MTMTTPTDKPEAPVFVDDEAMQIAERAITALSTVAQMLPCEPGATWQQHLREACAAAYNAGRRHSDAEHELIHDATADIAERRASIEHNALVASLLEAAGVQALCVNLAAVAGVFDRVSLTAHVEDAGRSVVYRLNHKTDQPTNQPMKENNS